MLQLSRNVWLNNRTEHCTVYDNFVYHFWAFNFYTRSWLRQSIWLRQHTTAGPAGINKGFTMQT